MKTTFWHNRKKKGVPVADEDSYSDGQRNTFLRLWVGKMGFPVERIKPFFLKILPRLNWLPTAYIYVSSG